jgi:AraC-like DNA-binding protein
MAKALDVNVVNNRLTFPSSLGKGYMHAEELPNGLLTLYNNFTLNTELHFERTFSDEEMYTLRFEHIKVDGSLVTKIDDEYYREMRDERKSVYLTCSLFNLGYFASKGSSTNTVSIQLTRDWMAKYLKMETYDLLLNEYLSLKTASLLFEPLDGEYQMILDEIAEMNEDHPAHKAMINNKVMYLVERFFTNLYEKRNQLKYHIKASNDDIYKIRQVEASITRDLTEPCPSITELSKMASMSPSKFKQLFKDIYGRPVYQHFQHNRMLKARNMLLSNNFSIKEVGLSLGYANLSNFSTAFRKEFSILPSQLRKEELSV